MRYLNSFNAEMIVTYLSLLVFTFSSTLSVGSTSGKQHVIKREANGDSFPDWVPFKNKHGDELGEFVDVVKKKPKKRLALPANFVLKSEGDQDVDEYIEKGPEEANGDDYFDKKEWSHSALSDSVDSKPDPAKIADIDGIVNIITKPEVTFVDVEDKPISEDEEVKVSENKEQTSKVQKQTNNVGNDSRHVRKETKKDEEDYDYDEKVPETPKVDNNIVKNNDSESEAKKARILNSVDQLKERHAEEQRRISEKIKEDEMDNDESEKGYERLPRRQYDKYENKQPPEWRKGSSEYDDYDEKLLDMRDKYRIIAKKSVRTTSIRPLEVTESEERLSLFSNPNAFLIRDYDDNDDKPTTSKPKRNKDSKNTTKKFSSRYYETEPKNKERVRISLVPEENDSKEGEPTLFFPKKRLGKRRFKTVPTPPNSTESVTTQSKTRRTPQSESDTGTNLTNLGAETTETDEHTTAAMQQNTDSVPSAADTTLSATVVSENTSVTDPLSSATDKKEHKEPENFEYERGRGKEQHASNEEEHEEHGKKAYEGKHEDTKTSKGYHDKEDHLGKYDDHGGVDKEHHDESGHYGHHHHEEHGKKHAKYEESGKHSKGHSTKGSHDIHKKEEYEKNVEFFEEEGDSIEEEKHGGHHDESGHSEGGHFKKEELEKGHNGKLKGDSGHFSKGGFGHLHKGHKSAEGHDQHGRQNKEKFIHEGKENGKKWIYHHGVPPRTAHLVAIDRRNGIHRVTPRLYR